MIRLAVTLAIQVAIYAFVAFDAARGNFRLALFGLIGLTALNSLGLIVTRRALRDLLSAVILLGKKVYPKTSGKERTATVAPWNQ